MGVGGRVRGSCVGARDHEPGRPPRQGNAPYVRTTCQDNTPAPPLRAAAFIRKRTGRATHPVHAPRATRGRRFSAGIPRRVVGPWERHAREGRRQGPAHPSREGRARRAGVLGRCRRRPLREALSGLPGGQLLLGRQAATLPQQVRASGGWADCRQVASSMNVGSVVAAYRQQLTHSHRVCESGIGCPGVVGHKRPLSAARSSKNGWVLVVHGVNVRRCNVAALFGWETSIDKILKVLFRSI